MTSLASFAPTITLRDFENSGLNSLQFAGVGIAAAITACGVNKATHYFFDLRKNSNASNISSAVAFVAGTAAAFYLSRFVVLSTFPDSIVFQLEIAQLVAVPVSAMLISALFKTSQTFRDIQLLLLTALGLAGALAGFRCFDLGTTIIKLAVSGAGAFLGTLAGVMLPSP